MKKNYMKPEMCVVNLRHRSRLLTGSNTPDSYNNKQMKTYNDEIISGEEAVF